jgi:integrase
MNRSGGPLGTRALLKAWHEVQQRAGLPRLSFHTTRHAAASVLIAQGLPLKTVQEVLGHSLIGTTADIYGRLAEEAFQEAANAMERALAGP